MRMTKVFWGCSAGAVWLWACVGCSSDDRPPVVSDEAYQEEDDDDDDRGGSKLDDADDRGSANRDSGAADQDDDADGGAVVVSTLDAGSQMEAGGDPFAPSVEMLSPMDQSEPLEVFDDRVEVSCLIEGSELSDAGDLDLSTVIFELLDLDGMVLNSTPGTRGDGAGVFEATFNTQNVDSGPARVRCAAASDSPSARGASDAAQVFIDHGPLVEIVSPEEGAAESALGAVVFEYSVAPDELTDSDDAAAVSEVFLTLMGQMFEMTEREGQSGVYRTTIDFSDPERFEDVSTGSIQVSVSAINDRGVTSTTRYEFILDGTGPSVAIQSPTDTTIIGGTVAFTAKIEDDVSAVDWDTLVVSLNDLQFPYDRDGPWRISGSEITFTFETGEITGSIEQITANVNVRDIAGNVSEGAAVLYYRDEQPPKISLDPPNHRWVDEEKRECSLSFDPLGSSPNDGDRVPDLAQYRALVVDQTNTAEGSDVFHLAGVRPDSVDLFVRRHGEPLVIDTDNDGVCDDVDDDGTRFQELTGLAPAGAPASSPAGDTEPPAPYFECTFPDRQPQNLCAEQHSDLTYVLKHDHKGAERVIYAVSPDNGLECTGRRWELPSAGLSDYQGWVCLAVRAYDNVGNRGVSPPIRVCLDNGQVEGDPACELNPDEPPPDCTDGCADPPSFGFDELFVSD